MIITARCVEQMCRYYLWRHQLHVKAVRSDSYSSPSPPPAPISAQPGSRDCPASPGSKARSPQLRNTSGVKGVITKWGKSSLSLSSYPLRHQAAERRHSHSPLICEYRRSQTLLTGFSVSPPSLYCLSKSKTLLTSNRRFIFLRPLPLGTQTVWIYRAANIYVFIFKVIICQLTFYLIIYIDLTVYSSMKYKSQGEGGKQNVSQLKVKRVALETARRCPECRDWRRTKHHSAPPSRFISLVPLSILHCVGHN